MTRQEDVPNDASSKALVTGAVGRSAVSEEARGRSQLRADYVDHFVLATSTCASPEMYARAMFGDVPSPAEVMIWRGLLQLRLSKVATPRTVAGWRVAESSREWIRLEARSHSLTVDLIVSAVSDELALTTIVQYDRTFGRWVWTALSAVHRKLAPSLLVGAAASVSEEDRKP